MTKHGNITYRQYLKQTDAFQLLIKKADGKRQKKLMGLKNSYVVNNYGQHLRAAVRNII